MSLIEEEPRPTAEWQRVEERPAKTRPAPEPHIVEPRRPDRSVANPGSKVPERPAWYRRALRSHELSSWLRYRWKSKSVKATSYYQQWRSSGNLSYSTIALRNPF